MMMGEARDVMDRVTAAVVANDRPAVAAGYAEDVVAVTPDEGEVHGRDAVLRYLFTLTEPFPDSVYESAKKYEDGDTAIDEGYLVGTHTGPLQLPNGEVLEATGRRIRVRTCDIAQVREGLIVRHAFYLDENDFARQLGLGG